MNQNNSLTNPHDRTPGIVYPGKVLDYILRDDGMFPNNAKLPLLVYQGAMELGRNNSASIVEDLFESNSWSGSWRNGIYSYHHYHSMAHEVLGVYSGSAKVQMGGENGVTLTVCRADVVIIPAGVAHKNLGASADFRVVGAYPQGQRPDLCYGNAGERLQTAHNIVKVPMPQKDPVHGAGGPMNKHWRMQG